MLLHSPNCLPPPDPQPPPQICYEFSYYNRVNTFENEKGAIKNCARTADVPTIVEGKLKCLITLLIEDPCKLCDKSFWMCIQERTCWVRKCIHRPNLLFPPESSARFLHQFTSSAVVHEGSRGLLSLPALGIILIFPVSYMQSNISLSISSYSG